MHGRDTGSTLPLVVEAARFLRRIATILYQRRSVLWFGALAGAVAGLAVSFGVSPRYASGAKLLPFRSEQAVGGLAGLAGLAGVDLSSIEGEQTLSADLYPEIARTRNFVEAVGASTFYVTAAGDSVSAYGYFKGRERGVLELAVALPSRFVAMLRGLVAGDRAASTLNVEGLDVVSEEDIEVYEAIRSAFDVRFIPRTGVIEISTVVQNPVLAARLANIVARLLQDAAVAVEAAKARAELVSAERQLADRRAELEGARKLYARFVDQTRGAPSALAQVELQDAQNAYNLTFDLVRTLSAEVEKARLRESKDTPTFTVIERPSVPPRPAFPKRMRTVMALMLLGVLLTSALVLLRDAYRRATDVMTGDAPSRL